MISLVRLVFVLQLWCCAHSRNDFEDLEIEDEVHRHAYTLDTVFENKSEKVYYKKGKLTFHCINSKRNTMILDDVYSPFETKTIIKELAINDCKITTIPLVNSLRKLNINTDAIEKLFIISNNMEPLPRANHSKGLNLKSFGVSATHSNFFELNQNFFDLMTNLTTLMVSGTKIPPIPNTIHLKALSLAEVTQINWRDYCRNLEVLRLSNLAINETPKDWPSIGLPLKALRVDSSPDFDKFMAVSKIEIALKNITSLVLVQNEINALPLQMLQGSEVLIHLDLSINLLTDEQLLRLPLLKNLTFLKLAANKLIGWSLFYIMKQMPVLKELDVSRNNFLDLFCNFGSNVPLFTNNATQLERLSFEDMYMNPNCFEKAYFSKLNYKNISPIHETIIPKLKIHNLPKSNASTLTIDMLNYKALRILTENDDIPFNFNMTNLSAHRYNAPPKNTNLIVRLGKMKCKCQNYEFAKSLRENPDWIKVHDLKCEENGINIMEVNLGILDCFKTYLYDFPGCVTLKSNYGVVNTTNILECKNGMKSFVFDDDLIWYNFTDIDFSDNEISYLRDTEWPDSVKTIDVRGNRISRLEVIDIARIFSVPGRKVFLSQNPLICDCESKPMLDALHENRDQVLDFDDLMCDDSNRTLSTITSFEACLRGRRIGLTTGGTIVTLLVIIILILLRYRLQVRIYLYSRCWCIFCFTEDDESDRPYDAFLSFSHGDDDYVMNELLPRLEGDPDHFRVCVHYRDWLVGYWIPSNIMRSVSLSKRTIIVLSRNFVQSLWGSLEFRYAVASSAKEGQPRLLVLVLDDVLSGELDAELQAYISCNTYLHCDDPWFWEKLRYAMPRRKPRARSDFNFQSKESDGHGIINTESRQVMIMQPLAADQPIIHYA